jgi:hypothetical protein
VHSDNAQVPFTNSRREDRCLRMPEKTAHGLSSGSSPVDCFLLGEINEKLRGSQCKKEDKPCSLIDNILTGIFQELLCAAFGR